jgi:hypothetical protein
MRFFQFACGKNYKASLRYAGQAAQGSGFKAAELLG